MGQCWWLQELVEIRVVCWQRWGSAGGCRNWFRLEWCVGRDEAVLVALGTDGDQRGVLAEMV